MQARSGLIAASGGKEAGPTVVGAAVVDQHGASLLAMGILAAFILNSVDQARESGSADLQDLSSAWNQTLTDVGPLARHTFWRSAR